MEQPMEMRQLRIFCAVAEEGSFTAAAERVHTVQSNVTMRVKELEQELGHQLFFRQKAGAMLTPAGETFLSYAQRILLLTDESHNALKEDAAPSGRLRLGAMETTAAIRLPPILTEYRKLFPQVKLSLSTGTTMELLKLVESHRIDGAFVGGFHQSAALWQEEVFKEELVVVSSNEHRSLQDLTNGMSQQTVLVFRAGCFYRWKLENWFYQLGLMPDQILELGTLDGILSCVASGMGITILPRSAVERYADQSSICAHSLPMDFGRVATVFARHADSFVTPAMNALLGLVNEHSNSPAPAQRQAQSRLQSAPGQAREVVRMQTRRSTSLAV
jgi:DNA-binding transcriptional LysR family regulator